MPDSVACIGNHRNRFRSESCVASNFWEKLLAIESVRDYVWRGSSTELVLHRKLLDGLCFVIRHKVRKVTVDALLKGGFSTTLSIMLPDEQPSQEQIKI